MGQIIMIIGIIALVITSFLFGVVQWFHTKKGFEFFMSQKPNDPELDDITEEDVHKMLNKVRLFALFLVLVSCVILAVGISMNVQPKLQG